MVYSVLTLFGVFFIITGANTIIFGTLFNIFGAKAFIFGTSLVGDYFIIFGAYFNIFGAYFARGRFRGSLGKAGKTQNPILPFVPISLQ